MMRGDRYVKRCHIKTGSAVAIAQQPLKAGRISGVDWRLEAVEDGFDLHFAGHLLCRHRSVCPALVMARGAPDVTMRHGNFRIEDKPTHSLSPAGWRAEENAVVLCCAESAARIDVWTMPV
jgi:hypothetical protein